MSVCGGDGVGGWVGGLMQIGVQVGNLLFLMVCKHCSFKSYCIKPWIPSITELQNGNKKGGKKNTSSSLRASPSAGSPAGQAAVSPSPTLSRLRPAACTGELGTDLSSQASPTPGDQGQGQGLPCTPQSLEI